MAHGQAQTRIFLHPAVLDQKKFDELISRLSWYFGPLSHKLDSIRAIVGPELSRRVIPPPDLDPAVTALAPKILDLLCAIDGDTDALLSDIRHDRDILLVWSKSAADDIAGTVAAMRKHGRYYEIDPDQTKMEGSFLLWAGARNLVDAEEVLETSRRRLAEFVATIKTDKVYVFGTGPSLSDYVANHDFDDGVCIVSNSMVKNTALLTALKPRVIVAGDPLFHAGVSRYAAEFRRCLTDALDLTGAVFCVPMRDHHIYQAALPERLRERLIAIPFDAARPYNCDLRKNLYVNPKANVLTLFLLPIASTLAREVRIVGCDGRPLDEDEYFWAHDKAAQFNDEMDNIKRVHPGFFLQNYADYYADHCKVTAESVEALEREGRTVRSMTPSYVPALRDRYADPLEQPGRVGEVISIDPDALGNFGHFLSYDGRLRDQAERLGVAFGVFGNKAFDKSQVDGWNCLEPVFSLHSWTVGNRPKGPAPEDVATFERELSRALELRRARGLTRATALYMYCGSLPHLGVLMNVIEAYPECRVNLNLFWTSFIPYREPAYVAQWRDTLERALAHPRVTVTTPTESLSSNLEQAFGLRVPVAPHPSTTFTDDVLERFTGPRPLSATPLVLFPGGMRPEKGFVESCAVAARLERELGRELRVVLRAYEPPNVPKGMVAVRDSLSGTSVEVATEDLDDAAFARFMDKADLIVLPYKSEAFRERTSGLLIDAMLLGRPVVVLEDTWLADIAVRAGFGVAAKDDPDSILAAIRFALDHHAELCAAAVRYRSTYLASESWSRLLYDIVTSGSAPDAPATWAPPARPAVGDVDALMRLKGRHAGQRCFIMGNGPSLNRMDLGKLAGETVFACNGIDLLFDRIDWRPAYYACVDSRVLPDRAPEIRAMLAANPEMIGFFPEILHAHDGSGDRLATRELLGPQSNAVLFNEVANDPSAGLAGMFSLDVADRVVMPFTVTVTMLQLAAWMGFSEMYLIGCDTAYSIPDSVKQEGALSEDGARLLLTSTLDDDPNHFDPRYFGKGRRWHNPQVSQMTMHYGYAKRALDMIGLKAFNATAGGNLEVFPRADFESLFKPPTKPASTPAERKDTGRSLVILAGAGGGSSDLGDPASATMALSSALVGDPMPKPTYLVATAAETPGRIGVKLGDSSLRRALATTDFARKLNGHQKVLGLDSMRSSIGLPPGVTPSELGVALLWAEALGFDDISVIGAGSGGTPDDVWLKVATERLKNHGVVVRFLE